MRGWLNTLEKVDMSCGWAAWGLVTPLHTWARAVGDHLKSSFGCTWHSPVPEVLMHSALLGNE